MNNIEKMFKETTIHTRKSNGELRRYHKREKWYRVLWDLCNPDQPCKDFDIHHIDFNELNDDISNLVRLTKSEHTRLHMNGNKNWLGKHHSEETKQKISENHADFSGVNHPFYGKHHSEEAKKKMSKNHPRARAVSINGQIFSTCKEAAEYLNVSPPTIRNRIQTHKPGYFYLT